VKLRHLLVFLPVVAAPRAGAQQPAKQVLTAAAFDGWRSIHGATLSTDGRWAAYSLVPQVGDGEVVVRDLETGREYRHTRGFIGRPQTKAGASRREAISFPPARFTRDGRFVLFTIEPERAEVERARHQKKKPNEGPKGSLGIMSTATGQVTVIPRVKSFHLAESPRYVAYLLYPPDSAAKGEGDEKARDTTAAPSAAAVPGGAARPVADSAAGHKKKEYGSTLVLRELATGAEVRIEDVTAYAFDTRGAWLGYTVSSRTEAHDGAYVRSLASGTTTALLSGKGRYHSLAFDSAGTQVSFVADRDDQARAKPRFTLYQASLTSSGKKHGHDAQAAFTARALVTPAMLGDSLVVSSDAPLTFSSDGRVLEFGVAPPPLDSIPADSLADKAVFDLWHWKDDRLQPQQRVEAGRDRDRAFAAVYRLDARVMHILGSDSLPRVELARNGRTALAVTDVPYRIEAMWGEGGSDVYAIDATTGMRTLVRKRAPFRASLSPDGKYVLYFGDDGHWYSYAVATKRTADLTGKLAAGGVRFDQETWDTPSEPAPWGIGGWTRGDGSVLLYDRYDIWEVDPSGARPPRMLTDSVGRRQHLIFRVAELDTAEVPLDPSRPLVLHAMDDSTKASGFWQDRLDATAPPTRLLMADRRMDELRKAEDANVYLFTQSTFREFPDLWVAKNGFVAPSKISNANPQQQNYKWGTVQLVSWRTDDGVPIRGLLFKPDGFDPAKQYPMVVYFYEQLSDNLHAYVPPAGRNIINPTVYVSNDYLVFEPDIHYETGYPGPSALKSIVPGVQMLIDSGFVNPHAVGIQGHSWGGYQTAYIITQTSMFKAAMAGAPVANMTSAYGGIRWETGLARAFQYEHTQSRIGGSLWQYPMRYLENSPLFAADRVTTPLLIMSNDGDGAVPWYQGIELFVALRRFGKEVYLIDYNGDGHNPTKRANQLDIAMRMQQFFDHHLKGAPAPDWMQHGIPFLDKGRDQLTPAPVAAAGNTTSASEPRQR
jgi:dienelactone hydrolase